MILTIDFNFTGADKCDPMSQADCEVVNILLDGKEISWRVDTDPILDRHLLAALYRLHQIMTK